MNDESRALGLLAQIARGLLRHDEVRTVRCLGDRSAYVGMSDVGRAITCQRAAVASKLGLGKAISGDDISRWLQRQAKQPILAALRRQLILQRGHWLETGLESALLANSLNLIPQLEITTSDGDAPLRAHLDFTLAWDKPRPTVRILELKSTEHLPDTLYPEYEAQIHGQVGLLAELWNKPAFGVAGEGRHTFPEICHQAFGIDMPLESCGVDIEGWVLCLSMSDAKAFGPYQPNAGMLKLCRRTAEHLWSQAQAVKAGRVVLNDLQICFGFHPLCDWCDHAEGCPKFVSNPVRDPAIDTELDQLVGLKADKAALEAEIGLREARIRQFCGHAGNHPEWLSTGHFRFRTSRVPGRRTLDSSRLRMELADKIGADDADDLLARSTVTGAAYERLTISPIKHHHDEEPFP